MLTPFFTLAMATPNRQRSFRAATLAHVATVSLVSTTLLLNQISLPLAGQILLVAGIVEGAVMIGWRLTQIPKSQSLEFLLVSPVQPKNIVFCEVSVGIARLALVTLAGLPLLVLLQVVGKISALDVAVLCVTPFTWGAVTGLGLTAWAYESRTVRRFGEWLCLAGIVVYLLVGVLAGENLRLWLDWLPPSIRWWSLELFGWAHTYNPFAIVQSWFSHDGTAELAVERMIGLQLVGLGCLGLIAMRAATRLRGHFHDRHYRPLTDSSPSALGQIGDTPLSWWAVRRVMEYSGRVNLWLAGGFGLLYAAYTIAGDRWPPWLGRVVFQLVDRAGGLPALTAGLAVLAAVPACFQYGLWDSSLQDRCRRLELLLLTELDGRDYWNAASAAAWRRGRGYFAIAVLLWSASAIAGRSTLLQILAATSAATILWGLSFVLGFWAFARGRQANGFGSAMTIGLPALTIVLAKSGWPMAASLLPPGSVFYALKADATGAWTLGPLLCGILALWFGISARVNCDLNLRAWFDANSGRAIAD